MAESLRTSAAGGGTKPRLYAEMWVLLTKQEHMELVRAASYWKMEHGRSAERAVVLHESRNDPDHAPAGRERAFCQRTHRSGTAASIDDRPARAREQVAQAMCHLMVERIAGLARSAVNADAPPLRR